MANVTVTCNNFSAPYAAANGVRALDVSPQMVLRAVVTVGAQRFRDVFSSGWRSLLHRVGMGLSAISFLERSHAGLRLSDRYGSLDASEKGAGTYWYGMALAKIVADAQLSVPWLAHVDQMRDNGALIIQSGSNERGDLCGRGGNGDWHVVEAKGRSNAYSSTLIAKAKRQSARVTSINGQQPATTSACITSLFTQPISVLLDDPTPDEEVNGEHWRITDVDFFTWYYRGIIEYLRQSPSRSERMVGSTAFVVAPIFPFIWDFDPHPRLRRLSELLQLGLSRDIYGAPERAAEAVREFQNDADGYVGSDGIAIFGQMPDWEAT